MSQQQTAISSPCKIQYIHLSVVLLCPCNSDRFCTFLMGKVLSSNEQSQLGTPYLLIKWNKADSKHLSEGGGQQPELSAEVWTRMLLLIKAKVSMNPRKGAKPLEE